jgi:hypothetical protein
MKLGAFFFDERSRRSAVVRLLIRARIYLLTGFFVAGANWVTLAVKHSGASSALNSLASSSPAQPVAERQETTPQVATLRQSGVNSDHPPSDPTTASEQIRPLEAIATAGASSSDRQPDKASAPTPEGKPANARAKRKAPARRTGREYSRGYGSYGGYGGGYMGGP